MSRKKVVVSLALSLGIIFAVPTVDGVVQANTTSQIEAERSLLQSEIEEKKQELQEVQAELVELNEEIQRVDEAIEANEMMIEETEEEVTEKEEEISRLEEEVSELEEDIERRNDLLKDRAASIQRNGGSVGYLEVLFGAESFGDFINRVSMITKIAQADSDLIERFQADQEKLEIQKKEVEDKLKDLKEVQEELEMMQAMILTQKEEHEANKAILQEREAESQALVEELQLEDNELARVLEEARAEAARREAERRAEAQRQAEETARSVADTGNNDSSGEIQQYSASSSGSGSISNVISAGYKYIGRSSYRFGAGRNASDIANGYFDCSSFVQWAFSTEGISIPTSTSGQSQIGSRVSTSQMQPGDLVFFDTVRGRSNSHVGIYIGNNKFIGAQTSTGVAVADMSSGYWADAFKGHVRRVQ
ncbi:peptidoglycan hydrolase CwlO-like protein [Natronobacillus azotifigens]|uniref:NlpC/P60 family protein n=1 Tax=Natronobacillus azotifigens TaxID=472978 RepID=A0A9J6R9I3_9BACI|nr:NlpC/P60 family protein [Natronobacillus azotifigens]